MDPKTPDQKVKNGSPEPRAGDDTDSDDFLDDGLEEDLDDSSWEEEEGGDSGESGFEEPVKRKKTGLFSFNTIVIVLAVVFGGGFVLTQMAKRGASIQSADVVAPVSRLQMSGMRDNPVFKDVRKEPQRLPQEAGIPPAVPPSGVVEDASPALPPPGLLQEAPPLFEGKNTESKAGEPAAQTQEIPREPASDVLTPLPSLKAADPNQDASTGAEEALSGDADPLAPFRKKKPVASTKASEDTRVLSEEGVAKDLSFSRTAAVPAVPVQDVVKTDLSRPPAEGGSSTLSDLPPVKEGFGHSSGKDEGGLSFPSKAISEDKPLPGEGRLSSDDVTAFRKALSGLEDRLLGLESRLDEVAKKRSPAASVPVSQDSDIQEIKASIARLQKDLAGAVRGSAVDKTVQEGKAKEAAHSPGVTKREGKTEFRKTTRSTVELSKTQSRPESDRKSSSPRWEIRAIQPGVAWVAPPGGDDMQTVEVGDTLPGLGTIRSISVVDGIWVIDGTKGRLQQ